jgi:hypothetical protein
VIQHNLIATFADVEHALEHGAECVRPARPVRVRRPTPPVKASAAPVGLRS